MQEGIDISTHLRWKKQLLWIDLIRSSFFGGCFKQGSYYFPMFPEVLFCLNQWNAVS